MQDVEGALARAFARRGTSRESSATPPAPHFLVEPGPERAVSRPGPAPSDGAGPTFSTGPEGRPTVLEWPATVRALERDHGERFRRLADSLAAIRAERGTKVLLFTSCHRAEGRTTLVLTLARALGRHPGRTLVVDADLSGPMLARQLGFRPRFGLDDVIEDGRPLADAIVDAPDDHIALLPLRAPVANPREFLARPAWACAMAKLRREYDLILVDGSPLFAGLSAATLHSSVDAAILVHHRALTGERALLRAREVLEAGGVPLLGLAETFV